MDVDKLIRCPFKNKNYKAYIRYKLVSTTFLCINFEERSIKTVTNNEVLYFLLRSKMMNYILIFSTPPILQRFTDGGR